jgi:hypothetical protein
MPRLSVWMIRAALTHLGIGFLFGGLMLANKGVPFEPRLWRLLPVHIDLLLIGWLLQLAMGVAFWIAPRFSDRPRYGRAWLVGAAFILLNSGVLLSAGGDWSGTPGATLVGWGCILTAGLCFVIHLVPRIKPLAVT